MQSTNPFQVAQVIAFDAFRYSVQRGVPPAFVYSSHILRAYIANRHSFLWYNSSQTLIGTHLANMGIQKHLWHDQDTDRSSLAKAVLAEYFCMTLFLFFAIGTISSNCHAGDIVAASGAGSKTLTSSEPPQLLTSQTPCQCTVPSLSIGWGCQGSKHWQMAPILYS